MGTAGAGSALRWLSSQISVFSGSALRSVSFSLAGVTVGVVGRKAKIRQANSRPMTMSRPVVPSG